MAVKTITRKVTYLGVPAKVTEIRQAGANGEREIRIEWLGDAIGQPIEHPAGTVTSKTVTGNALKDTFKILVPEHVVS
jgi:hypothetical protein